MRKWKEPSPKFWHSVNRGLFLGAIIALGYEIVTKGFIYETAMLSWFIWLSLVVRSGRLKTARGEGRVASMPTAKKR